MLKMLAVLAHQGGWDEALIVAVPIALFGLWKLWERRRGGPAEPHRWDRDEGAPGAAAADDGGDSGDGSGSD